MTEGLKTIETVDTSPFRKLIMTLGELPTSFVESMTFYECIAWLVNYIQNTVIPTVNNNAEALQELQDYIKNLDLHGYIDQILKEYIDDGTFYETLNYDKNTESLTLTFDMARS